LRAGSKAFASRRLSFREDTRTSFKHLDRFGVAEDDDLPAIEHGAETTTPKFGSEPIPPENPFNVPNTASHDATFRGGLRREHMDDPLIRIKDRWWTTGGGGRKYISHELQCKLGVINMA